MIKKIGQINFKFLRDNTGLHQQPDLAKLVYKHANLPDETWYETLSWRPATDGDGYEYEVTYDPDKQRGGSK